MRLIDADAFLEAIKNDPSVLSKGLAVHLITNAPTVKREGWKLVPIEPTEEMISAYKENMGGIIGTPENLANAEYIKRANERQERAAVSHYKAMISAAPDKE